MLGPARYISGGLSSRPITLSTLTQHDCSYLDLLETVSGVFASFRFGSPSDFLAPL